MACCRICRRRSADVADAMPHAGTKGTATRSPLHRDQRSPAAETTGCTRALEDLQHPAHRHRLGPTSSGCEEAARTEIHVVHGGSHDLQTIRTSAAQAQTYTGLLESAEEDDLLGIDERRGVIYAKDRPTRADRRPGRNTPRNDRLSRRGCPPMNRSAKGHMGLVGMPGRDHRHLRMNVVGIPTGSPWGSRPCRSSSPSARHWPCLPATRLVMSWRERSPVALRRTQEVAQGSVRSCGRCGGVAMRSAKAMMLSS